MSAIIEVDYFNTYILKKVVGDTAGTERYAIWPNVIPAKTSAGGTNEPFPGTAAEVTPGNANLQFILEFIIVEVVLTILINFLQVNQLLDLLIL